jgi:O-antigen/teichoic acid export membrane protein
MARDLTRRVVAVTSTTALARVLTALMGLLTVPILIQYLGPNAYGSYTAIISMSTVFVVADQGLAVGVRTRIAEDLARGQHAAAYANYLAGRRLTHLACSALATAGLLVAFIFPWEKYFAIEHARLAIASYLVCNSLSLVATVRLRALEALGRSSMVASLPILGSGWLLATIMLGVGLNAEPLFFLATAGLYNLLPLMVSSLALRRHLPRAQQDPDSGPPTTDLRSAFTDSWPMAVVSLMLALSYGVDPILIGMALGEADAAQYSVTARLHQLALVLVTAATPVLWTHMAAERVNGVLTVNAMWRRTVPLLVLAIVAGAGLVLFGPLVIDIWISGAVAPSSALLWAFAAFLIVVSLQVVPGTALTDAASLRFQVKTTTLMAAVNLPLSLFLALQWGVSGPVWASAIALASCHGSMLWLRAVRAADPRPSSRDQFTTQGK